MNQKMYVAIEKQRTSYAYVRAGSLRHEDGTHHKDRDKEGAMANCVIISRREPEKEEHIRIVILQSLFQ